MSTYAFVAKTQAGKKIKGKKESDSKKELSKSLKKEGFVLLSSEKITMKKPKDKPCSPLLVIDFTASMIFNLQGMQIVEVLESFAEECSQDKRFAEILRFIIMDIEAGITLGDSFAKWPRTFGDLYSNVITLGENSGKLPENLAYLLKFLKFELSVKKDVKRALMMPGIVLGGTIGVIIFLLTSVFPKLTANIDITKVEIPGPPAMMMQLSDLFLNYGIILAFAIAGSIYGLLWSIRTFPVAKRVADKLKLTLPIFSGVYKNIVVSRVSNGLTLMLGSGVPILESLEEAGRMSGNIFYMEACSFVSGEVEAGKQVAYCFKQTDLFPTMFINMVKVGEQSGSIDTALINVNEYYEKEIPDQVKTLTSLLEPILTVFSIGAVGFVFASFIMLMMAVADSMSA